MSARLRTVLSIDCSTTAAKAIVWDARGRPLAEGRGKINLYSPAPQGYEQDAEEWWTATCRAVRAALRGTDARRLRGVCIAHQRETFVVTDPSGRPARRAIVWMDERSRPQVSRLRASGQADHLREQTGKPVSTTPSLSKLLWLQDTEPQLFDQNARVLDVHAFLIQRLTGVMRTSLPSADPTGLVDLRSGLWCEAAAALAGLTPAQLPEIVSAGDIIGHVTQAASVACHLPTGLPVIAGAGDGQAAGLGAGLMGPGPAYLNLGTAVVSGVYSDTYCTDLAFRTMASANPGGYILETDLKGGTFTLNWLCERWLPGKGSGQQRLRQLERQAAGVGAGAAGLMLVPYWAGVMNPYWHDHASGMVIGWREDHGPVHLYRAILEGIAFEQRLQTACVEGAIGRPVERFILMGGGSASDLWCQILADVLGRPVCRAGSAEATSLGAAILAAWATGLHRDLASAVEAMTSTGRGFVPGAQAATYDRLFSEVYSGLYLAVADRMERLAECGGLM